LEQDIAPLARMAQAFGSLPGIGRKTAQRLAYAVLNMSAAQAEEFAQAIVRVRAETKQCAVCCGYTDREVCDICSAANRDSGMICVVESSRDVQAILRTHAFNGLFHVLHGAISPLNGIGPEDLTLKALLNRIGHNQVRELILATNASVEGEATAMYISRLVKPFGVAVTRLAYGIPVGSDLEYADEVTLARAIDGRRPL
jgi:recombination protein RecR